MSGWRRRWSYLWELAAERETGAQGPGLEGGRGRVTGSAATPSLPNTERARLDAAGRGAPGGGSAPAHVPAAPAAAGGGGAPLQRVPQDAPLAPPADPVVFRESVRVMLMWQHREQQRKAAARSPTAPSTPLELTPELEEALGRLIPTLGPGELRRIWSPPPPDSVVALARLMSAGHVPRLALPRLPEGSRFDPRALEVPPPQPEREGRFSPFSGGMVGLHFRVNPRRRARPEESIAAALRGRGIRLADRDLKALLSGREQGVAQIEDVLARTQSGLDPAQRRTLAETIADALLDRSLEGQLEGEQPTAFEREQERMRMLEPAGPGGLRGLLERLPVGASITFHFP